MDSAAVKTGKPLDGTRLAFLAAVYFAGYLTYLFFHQESEFWHWITLVLGPLLIVSLVSKLENPAAGLAFALGRLGLKKGNLSRGLPWVFILGAALSLMQVKMSRYWEDTRAAFDNGSWTILLPLAFLLMLLTAGFTEEFFFRGFLLNSLLEAGTRTWLAVTASAAAFAVYHLPYAYLNPNWPSAGDFPAALMQSFVEAFPVGILLGLVFLWSGRNLIACAVLHAMVNTLPAMALIKFNGQ